MIISFCTFTTEDIPNLVMMIPLFFNLEFPVALS